MLHFGKIPKKMVKFGRKFGKIWPNLGKFAKFWKTAKNSAIFNENFEIRERCNSFLSRFSLQPPFIEVLSGLLRAAYWPLVF